MSFFRHPEIFRSDVVVDRTKLGPGYRLPLVGPEAQSKDATEGTRPAHRLDESPAMHIVQDELRGLAWSPIDDKWCPFTVELNNGKSTGGSYFPNDAEGWETSELCT